jgi:Tfp pilus assembly protein PilF
MDLMAEYQRAGLYLEAGDPVEAAQILAQIVEAEPSNSQVRLDLALAYYGSAQLRRAETELRTLVEHDPSDHFAHHVLGRTLERLSRPAEALAHLRLADAMSSVPDYREAVQRVSVRMADRNRSGQVAAPGQS